MNYNIGDQIQRKVLKQNRPIGTIAKEIGIERQSLYDIFNSDSIKTSRFIRICKVLDYDFFADLSAVFNHREDSIVDNTGLDHRLSLIHKDEITVISPDYMLDNLVRKYAGSDSRQPLVIFHASGSRDSIPDILRHWKALDLGEDNDTLREVHRDMMFQQWDDGLKTEEIGSCMMLTYSGHQYSGAIANTVELMKQEGRHVVLLMSVTNELCQGAQGGLVYVDIADELFGRFHHEAHIVVCQDRQSRYLRRKMLYKAYCSDGLFDRFIRQFVINEEIEKQLFDLTLGFNTIVLTELQPVDETGYSRIKLSYPPLSNAEKEMMFANGVNDNPILEMWIDIRNGFIIDYQYRTQV